MVFVMVGDAENNALGVPEGYVAIPLHNGNGVPLRICILVRRAPDPVAGRLTILRDSFDALIYLGCITDSAGRVQDWVELWVQQYPASAGSLAAFRESVTNSILDDRWRKRAEAWEKADRRLTIKTAWESSHPLPMFIDVAGGKCFSPMDEQSRQPWALCEDDGLLMKKGLAPFTRSLDRYLYLKSAGENSTFIAASVATVEGKKTSARPLSEIVKDGPDVLSLNPTGGFISVRRYNAIALDQFADVLGGGAFEGVREGRSIVDPLGVAQALHRREQAAGSAGWLSFEPAHGTTFILESLHLKLRLLADAVEATKDYVRRAQRPILELSPSSFSVELADPGVALPYLWTANIALSDPGDAIPLPLPIAGAQYFASPRQNGAAIYRAPAAARMFTGRGFVRVPSVSITAEGQLVADLTLRTDSDIRPTAGDLLRFRLNLASGRFDLFARPDAESAAAAGEWRFRSLRHRVSDSNIVNAFKQAEGTEFDNILFELLPLLNAPCDLYSLAVIAVRTLLVGTGATLALSLDRVCSLAKQTVANTEGAPADLTSRIAGIFASDERWRQWLGAQNLLHDPDRSEQAARVVPNKLWYDVLAMIVRMLPGPGPERACRDYGDVPSGGIHKVFDRAASDLSQLLLRTRSLVVMDARQNREMRSVIEKTLASFSREPAARRLVPQS